MIAKDRQHKIIELIEEYGSVEVEKLANELKVSPMTIRRDLVKLEENNRIKRCHGGAVSMQEINYANKQISNIDEKKIIAKNCMDLVKKGDIVFLDAGTTTFEIAKFIKDIPDILVVTTDLKIASYLSDTSVQLMICGGTVQKNTGYVFGYYALQMVKDIQFDIGFFGAAIINNNFQILTPTEDKIFIKIEAKKQCSKSYVVADKSKFFKQSAMRVNNIAEYDAIITTKIFDEDEQKLIKKSNVSIISVN